MPIPLIHSSNVDDKSRDGSDGIGSVNIGNGSSMSQTGMSLALHPPHTSSSSAYDGIGELGFNEDYDNVSHSFSMSQAGTSTFTTNSIHQPQQAQLISSTDNCSIQKSLHPGYRPREDSITDIQRFRANSLAFGDLFEEPNPDDQCSLGKWMDQQNGWTNPRLWLIGTAIMTYRHRLSARTVVYTYSIIDPRKKSQRNRRG